MRKQYYGGGQYDLAETSLHQLTESLLDKRKAKEAAAFMELNAEVPNDSWAKKQLEDLKAKPN